MKNKALLLVVIFSLGMSLSSGVALSATGGHSPQLDNSLYMPVVMMNFNSGVSIVVDHRHADASKIPDYWIGQAKQFVVH